MISYGRQSINDQDVDSVIDVLKHHNLTQGNHVPAFEKALCDYTGAKYAIAVNSGTSALHIACLAEGVSEGDIVYTTPNTFVASANCALYCGASIDFVDIDPSTRQMSVNALEEKLIQARKENCVPKAVIVVHFAGHGCDLKEFNRLSIEFGFTLIEDNAHGLGGQYRGEYYLGNPLHSSMAICSFHPVKSITTAEGGAVLTNDAILAKRLRLFASHGITKESGDFHCKQPGVGHFEQQVLGYNYRLSDLHAALGVSQLNRIDDFVSVRFSKAGYYQKRLNNLPLELPVLDPFSAWHLYVIELTEHNKQAVFKQLVAKGIGVNVHYIPVHWHPYFRELGFTKGQYPNSENYYKNALTLPLFPDLNADNQEYVIENLQVILA